MGRRSEAGVEDLIGINRKSPQSRLAIDLNPTPEEILHRGRLSVQNKTSPLARLCDQINLIGLFKDQARSDALSRTPCQKQSEG